MCIFKCDIWRWKCTDGNNYVGEYKDNKKNGQGILYNASGNIEYQGEFIDRKRVTV